MTPTDMFCDAGLNKEPYCCLGCNLLIQSQDCLKYHKKHKCSSLWKCPDCEQVLRVPTGKGEKRKHIDLHQDHCQVWGGVSMDPRCAEDSDYF